MDFQTRKGVMVCTLEWKVRETQVHEYHYMDIETQQVKIVEKPPDQQGIKVLHE